MGLVIAGCLDFCAQVSVKLRTFQHRLSKTSLTTVWSELSSRCQILFKPEIVVGFVLRNRLTILVRNNKSTS